MGAAEGSGAHDAGSDRPLVSVISVVRNHADGLQRTLASVWSQEGVRLESVVVDGGSTDATLDVLKAFPETQWSSQPDDGPFDGMNRGLAAVNGDWVVFMNAGDTFAAPDVLERLQLRARGQAGVVYGAVRIKDRLYRPQDVAGALRRGVIFGCHQSMVFNRRLLQKQLSYDERFPVYADYELVARLFHQGVRFEAVDFPVACFEGGGMSGRVSLRKRLDKYRAVWRYFGASGMVAALAHRAFARGKRL
ncbi:glycosyltransferase family 2 protein [Thioalkalivibrio sp. ALJT]|uniref:glycosyltransferase family 2 protein n=1 Tax=Thioalkalivibrio sp. ALJT TaxID=1158146 RepID=UPI00037D9535|nr:glycosyltransferase family 2 protein [Thioalkalivibrio sp. ALJT]